MGCIHKYGMVKFMFRSLPLVLFGLAGLSAQSPPKQPPAPAEEDQVIRIDVDLVNIFFNVRDKRGDTPAASSRGLRVYEDGKKQEIRSFSERPISR